MVESTDGRERGGGLYTSSHVKTGWVAGDREKSEKYENLGKMHEKMFLIDRQEKRDKI